MNLLLRHLLHRHLPVDYRPGIGVNIYPAQILPIHGPVRLQFPQKLLVRILLKGGLMEQPGKIHAFLHVILSQITDLKIIADFLVSVCLHLQNQEIFLSLIQQILQAQLQMDVSAVICPCKIRSVLNEPLHVQAPDLIGHASDLCIVLLHRDTHPVVPRDPQKGGLHIAALHGFHVAMRLIVELSLMLRVEHRQRRLRHHGGHVPVSHICGIIHKSRSGGKCRQNCQTSYDQFLHLFSLRHRTLYRQHLSHLHNAPAMCIMFTWL